MVRGNNYESVPVKCWCGNTDLIPFSPGYLKCPACETLVTAQMPEANIARVADDEGDFYGREYWFSHQENDLGFSNIKIRSRTDLPERCLHWLGNLLKYKLPPGHVLELGSAHGGFVALLRWAGFDAIGLELSPWVVDFARQTLDVPMVLGPIEEQDFEEGSFDAIALMDVLEHFPDPVGTMQRCVDLLKSDGILLIQTPRVPEDKTYEDLVASNDRSLEQLKETEHLYLFSEKSIRQFFERLGCAQLYFEQALFEYDMFFVAGRSQVEQHAAEEIVSALSLCASGRLILAMLDQDAEIRELSRKWAKAEADRAYLQEKWTEAEADRAARLEVIQTQGAEISSLHAEIGSLHAEIERLRTLMRQAMPVTHFGFALPGEVKRIQALISQAGAQAKAPSDEESLQDNSYYASIREPKRATAVEYGVDTENRIIEGLQSLGFEVQDLSVDVDEYQEYFAEARYLEDYPDYYAFNIAEKSLEHYIAARLLRLDENDIYIDIASELSPVPEIYNRLFGCRTYRQDLAYPPGFHGDQIGGDAADMPIPDGFATKMALHCSFEHFEGDSDIRFVQGLNRVLKPGGAVCIVPLYLFEEYAIQTDPAVSVPVGIEFEDEAVVYCAKNWDNRHARFYDPVHLKQRVGDNLTGLTMTIYRITNAKQVDASCYIRFAALFRKP